MSGVYRCLSKLFSLFLASVQVVVHFEEPSELTLKISRTEEEEEEEDVYVFPAHFLDCSAVLSVYVLCQWIIRM